MPLRENDLKTFEIEPNPASGKWVEVITSATEIEILDRLGRSINFKGRMEKTNHGFRISTEKLTNGLYLIQAGSGAVFNTKLLVISKTSF